MNPIVLIHGAWHGPWCWDDVAADLRGRGHEVHEVTLPGHDHPGDHRRIWNRISQYVAAVEEMADSLPEPPVLVGHSMGGYTVQRSLETRTAAAGVLVASVPWRGSLRPNLRAIRRRPGPTLLAALTADYSRMVADAELVRELFFTPETPEDVVGATVDRLQNESALAITTMAVRRIRTDRITTPMFVIGAEGDAVFTVAEQEELAAVYGVEADIMPGGHDLMVDTTWPDLAARIDRIVTDLG
ncbi:MAG: alpha/beta hydrolase [Actinomycetota bacterium]